jgi:hypothetical protein
MQKKPLTAKSVYDEYQKGVSFNTQINLNDTVNTNENFFVGKQWEGVEANGLPTPVFNFLKQVTLFNVASITTDNIKMNASALSHAERGLEIIADVVNNEFEALFEKNNIGFMLREYMRNAAVDGDACLYTYFDPDAETGQDAKGEIRTEVIENTRVFFGNPNDRRVQKQPYIIIATRELVDDAKARAEENGQKDFDIITADTDENGSDRSALTDDKVTVLLRLWKDKKTGTIHAYECTKSAVIREEWDLGIRLYPITWLNWDYVQDSYHGQALITGLIPNQIFVNKLFAMSMISLMSTAFPRYVYDKTRISKMTNMVGAAIGVNGGDVSNVIKTIDPATISPQISQFIDSAINYTKTFLGATPAAMGETRPDNTSAIIALQRAAAIPSEITKQNLFKSIEDLGRIYIEFMAENYGDRWIEIKLPDVTPMPMPAMQSTRKMFDFSVLKDIPMLLKLDVGASAYWSEIASMTTLDNLLMQGKIEVVDYLERIPEGYISKKQALIDKIKSTMAAMPQQAAPGADGQLTNTGQPPALPQGKGYGELQRSINETGVVA